MDVIRVPNPQRWWFAKAEDMPWLVNPDAWGERPRWADRDERQWGAIAPVVDGLARALSAGEYDVERGAAVLHAELSGLEETDRKIVRSWFQPWQAPSADSWSTTMSDGRHRSWNSWRAAPGALLPLSSALLERADRVGEMSTESLRYYREDAAAGLATMPEEIARRAPGYVRELQRAATAGPAARPEPAVSIDRAPDRVVSPSTSRGYERGTLSARIDDLVARTTRDPIGPRPAPGGLPPAGHLGWDRDFPGREATGRRL